MNSATLKSIVLFLLNDVDVKTNENAIELLQVRFTIIWRVFL